MKQMHRQQKTILWICHGSFLGGAAVSFFEIAKRLDRNRFRVVAILPGKGPLREWLQKENIACRVIPLGVFYYGSFAKTFSMRNGLFFLASIRNLLLLSVNTIGNLLVLPWVILKEDPQIIILNSSTLFLSGLVAKAMKKKVVCHVREIYSTGKMRWLTRALGGLIRYATDRVIVHSEFSKNDMSSIGVKNTVLLPIGFDLKRLSPPALSGRQLQAAADPGYPMVGFVGQLSYEKGWRTLVQAAFMLVKRLPGIRFLIVGGRPAKSGAEASSDAILKGHHEYARFQGLVRELKLTDFFSFAGPQDNVENYFSMMSCLTFTSIAPETFGRVIAEAMACQVPVVASCVGASPEIVRHGITGLLVKAQDPGALARAIEEILTDPDQARAMGIAGRKRIEELYDIEKVLPRLEEVYFPPAARP